MNRHQKNLMKTLQSLLLVLITLSGGSVEAASWLTDFEAAKTQAAREGKTVMINFTGSDWCGWCIRLKQEVFSKPEFESFAAKNLVLVEIDFPKRKPQTANMQKANATLADKYQVGGYPTLLFVNAHGKEVHRGSYEPGGANVFVQRTAKAIGAAVGPSAAIPVAARPAPKAPEPELPLYGGAPAAPPAKFTDLVLKGISGTKDRRFALLNNQTLAAGDTAVVKLEDGSLKVRCLEIRERSVLVAVDGQTEPREIPLREIK